MKDIFKSFLINNATLTSRGYPIIPPEMVAKEFPLDLYQWNSKYLISNKNKSSICFYCDDLYLDPIIKNPIKYVDQLKQYRSVVGLDVSPFDNMAQVLQDYNIYINLAYTYFLGAQGIKIIPNLRLGNNLTLDTLLAYPKKTLLAIGTNGFIKDKNNQMFFLEQLKKAVSYLKPTGIIVYGPVPKSFKEYFELEKISFRSYASTIMKRAHERNKRKQ